jgi:hypothetical protein
MLDQIGLVPLLGFVQLLASLDAYLLVLIFHHLHVIIGIAFRLYSAVPAMPVRCARSLVLCAIPLSILIVGGRRQR